ncbi:MAG: ABC transporter ATP-binding protein [Kiritimatiellaceae bacterium]|nr:ABC transporter ATP-binding protein [Kiritimatiellaceae bacterium]
MCPQTPFRPLEYNYSSKQPVRTLLGLLNRPRWFYVATLLVMVIKHSPMWVIPFLIARVINSLADPVAFPASQLTLYFAAVVVLIVQNIPTHTLYVSMLSGAVRDLERTLRSALVTRLQHLSIAFHDRTETGRLQAKLLRDVEQVQMFCMQIGDSGSLAVLSFFFAVIVTAVRQPRLLVFFILLIPVINGLRFIFERRIRERNTAFRSEVEQMSAEVTEMLNMIPVVRAHGLEEEAARRMEAQFGAVNERGRRLDILNAVFGSSAFVVFQLSMVFGLIVMSWFCRKGWITVGDIVLYQSMFSTIVMSVSQLMNMYPQLARGIESVRSIGEVMESPDLEYNRGRRTVDAMNGHVQFQDMTFSYEKEKGPAIRNFSLDVAPGECIALVGPSGGGKSTLMQLLIGFRRPQQGRILFDGQDMEEIDMRTARRFISVVPQETVLFSGTIRENITYGLTGVRDERLREILAAANLIELVDGLPKGLDTRIGEDGALLSGGQRQRIAIARALIRNPRILVLDEATSALDVVSEKKVQEAIELAVQHRTTFIVAHRLSTIRKANRIVVMKDGQIEEVGSYDELMTRRGYFFEMQQLQH